MRLTAINSKRNMNRMYKYMWYSGRNLAVKDSGESSMLKEKGFKVEDSKKYLNIFNVPEPNVPKKVQFLHQLDARHQKITFPEESPNLKADISLRLMADYQQSQIITNSLIFHHLPDHLQEKMTQNTEEEEDFCHNAIKESHLMDAYRVKQPNRRSFQERKQFYQPVYDIPDERKNKLLVLNHLMELDKKCTNKELSSSFILPDTSVQVTANHNDRKITFDYTADYVTLRTEGLSPILSIDEIDALKSVQLPDIFPQSPYVNFAPISTSNDEDSFCTNNPLLVPNTVYLQDDHSVKHWTMTDDHFTGKSMLAAFTYAASYARQKYGQNLNSDLPSPVTIHLVNFGRHELQFCVFQLNTLNLTGGRKNFFWYLPRSRLYETCKFEGAKPTIIGLNANLYNIFKCAHLN